MLRFDTGTSTTATLVRADDVVIVEWDRQGTTSATDTTATTQRFYSVSLWRQYVGSENITPVNPPVIHWRTRREVNNEAAVAAANSLAAVHARVPKKALVLRASYQQMARLPCYRGRRAR